MQGALPLAVVGKEVLGAYYIEWEGNTCPLPDVVVGQ